MEVKTFNQNAQGRTVFYAGDDDSDRAAAYLLCLLCDSGYRVEYLPSPQKLGKFPSPRPDLFILSDYPRRQVTDEVLEQLARGVEDGMHLLVIGGWESFHGKAGEYHQSPLDRVLPVKVAQTDDRENTWQGVVVQPARDDGPFGDLDWSAPPAVAGYNRLNPLADSQILLEGRHLQVSGTGAGMRVALAAAVPLACTRNVGKGRGTVLGFDLAPHWVAGAVDWGKPRRELNLPDGSGVWVEVGSMYARFVRTLLSIS